MNKNKIIVTGASGMLGNDLVSTLKKKMAASEIKGVTRKDFDITNRDATCKFIKKNNPSIVINTAAFTNVDKCETEQNLAFKVNGEGAENIANACFDSNSKLIHVSTDYVFSGDTEMQYSEKDIPSPINVYGKSKLLGENNIKKSKVEYLIVRTSWLYGSKGVCFPKTIMEIAAKKKRIEVVNDQYGTPTYTLDLSLLIKESIVNDIKGTINLTNSGMCSWFDFAKKVLELSGDKYVEVVPVETKKLNRLAPRPAFSVLNNNRFKKVTGDGIRSWEEALKDYIKTIT